MNMKTVAALLFFASTIQASSFIVSNSLELNETLPTLASGDSLLLKAGNYSADISLRDIDNITITSVKGGRAVLDGTTPISSPWVNHSGSIFKTKLDHPIWQLFILVLVA